MIDETRRGRLKLRFSLRGMLVAALMTALVISNLTASYRLRETRRELKKIRDEVGYLTVFDPGKVHVVAIPNLEPQTFRWRVFLPEGRKLAFMTAISNIPDRQFPDLAQTNFNERPFEESQLGSEFILTVAIVRDPEGGWRFSWDDGVRNLSMPLPPDEFAGLNQSGGFGRFAAGGKGTETFSPDERVLLFRMRKSKVVPQGVTVDPNPCPGILVWIEER